MSRVFYSAPYIVIPSFKRYSRNGSRDGGEIRREPVKTGLYDFLQYSKQMQQTASQHRKVEDRKGHDDGEFLSRFYKEDKLTPVITLVILFGSKKWDGPRPLQEMMSTQDPDILKYVADYKLNLIAPAAMGADDLKKFHSNLRAVLFYKGQICVERTSEAQLVCQPHGYRLRHIAPEGKKNI